MRFQAGFKALANAQPHTKLGTDKALITKLIEEVRPWENPAALLKGLNDELGPHTTISVASAATVKELGFDPETERMLIIYPVRPTRFSALMRALLTRYIVIDDQGKWEVIGALRPYLLANSADADVEAEARDLTSDFCKKATQEILRVLACLELQRRLETPLHHQLMREIAEALAEADDEPAVHVSKAYFTLRLLVHALGLDYSTVVMSARSTSI